MRRRGDRVHTVAQRDRDVARERSEDDTARAKRDEAVGNTRGGLFAVRDAASSAFGADVLSGIGMSGTHPRSGRAAADVHVQRGHELAQSRFCYGPGGFNLELAIPNQDPTTSSMWLVEGRDVNIF